MSFTLIIDTNRGSITNPFSEDRPSLEHQQRNRRRQVAALLRTVALMMEQGREKDIIRDHQGNVVGKYDMGLL